MRACWWSLGMLLAAALPAAAGEPPGYWPPANYKPPCPYPGYVPPVPPGVPAPAAPTQPPQQSQAPATDQPAPSALEPPAGAGTAFAGAGEAGTGSAASAAQYTFGDLVGASGCAIPQRIFTFSPPALGFGGGQLGAGGFGGGGQLGAGGQGGQGGFGGGFGGALGAGGGTGVSGGTGALGTSGGVPGGSPSPRVVCPTVPVPNRYGGIKISDYESPRPASRVYAAYNYYYNVNGSTRPEGTGRIDVHREIAGFEAAWGNASFGMRLPFAQAYGTPFSEEELFGDLTMNFKYALVNDSCTGNVLSGGLVLTAPTGERTGIPPTVVQDGVGGFSVFAVPELDTRSWLFQPWVGGILNLDRLFLIGFSSVIIPTDDRDPTVWFNTLSAGFQLYRADPCADQLITGFTPVVEVHVNTPLTNRDDGEPIFLRDQVNLTTGAYLTLQRVMIGGAVGVPLVGPKPFDVEALANVQFRF